MSEAKPELHVSVWVGELPTIPDRLASAVASVAERERGRDVVVTESEDGSEVTIGFVLDRITDDGARAVGHLVLDAVDIEDFVWTVTVVERF